MLVISGMFRETRLQTTVQGAIAVILGCTCSIFGYLRSAIASIHRIYRDIDLLFSFQECYKVANKKYRQKDVKGSY